jgi:hypothetical protein
MLTGALNEQVNSLIYKRMDDIFELLEGFRFAKDQPSQFLPVDLGIFIQDPTAKHVNNRLITGCPPGNNTMRQCVRIDPVRAQMFQHLPHHTLACGNIAGETDDVFSRPLAHGFSFQAQPSAFILAVGSGIVKGNAESLHPPLAGIIQIHSKTLI